MRKGFSLVELMVGVAIVGILATIAIPRMREMQLRAKIAEAYPNMRGIGDAATAYYASTGEWPDGCTTNPGAPLTKRARSWRPNLTACWTALAWEPDGLVRCTYYMARNGSSTDQYELVSSECDVDDDNRSAIFRHYVATATRQGYYRTLYTDRY